MVKDSLYWIWLGLSLGYGSRSVKPLWDAFGSVAAIYSAGSEELADVENVSPMDYAGLLNKDLSLAEEVANYCLHRGVGILAYADEQYPKRLKDIDSPPAVLYYRGRIPAFDVYPTVGMVGARAMTHYGASVAYETAYDLGRMGFITISGMALGIDGVCAASTLAAAGATVAVLGSGIDRIYPPEHIYLYHAIIECGGLVLTEFPPFEKPNGFHFPLRNRIIAGLSDSLIMVEGNAKSGALITSEMATKMGKAVYAVPGNVFEKNSEGPHLLLQRGAAALVSADILYDKYKESHYGKINGFTMQEERRYSMEEIIELYDVHCDSPKLSAAFSQKQNNFLEERRRKPSQNRNTEKDARAKIFFERPKKPSVSSNGVLRAASAIVERSFTDAAFEVEKEISLRDEDILQKLNGREKEIYQRLSADKAMHLEELTPDGVSMDEIATILVLMETKGYIQSLPGDFYRKTKG